MCCTDGDGTRCNKGEACTYYSMYYSIGEGKPNRLCPWPAAMLLYVGLYICMYVVLIVVLSVQEDDVPIMLVCVIGMLLSITLMYTGNVVLGYAY